MSECKLLPGKTHIFFEYRTCFKTDSMDTLDETHTCKPYGNETTGFLVAQPQTEKTVFSRTGA